MLRAIQSIVLLLVSMTLTACAVLTPPSNDLAVVSCPVLTPPYDNSFEATTLKLIEVVGIYRKCRAAALQTKEAK
jgi:hypothetical protein